MSTFKTVEARVWEHDNGEGDSLVAIAYPGRVTQVSRANGEFEQGVTIRDVSDVPAEVATLQDALTKLKGMDAASDGVGFAIAMVESVLAALDYAFPGCGAAAGEGGGA